MGAGENISNISDGFILSRMDPAEILNLAGEFVVQYYTVMRKCPSGLHRFYKDDSTMIHEDSPTFGQKLIHEKFMSMNLYDLRVGILHVDALRSGGNGVLIQVCGEIAKDGCDYRRFMQSFVLCEQSPCDFYVLNDIFRYQDIVYGDAKSGTSRIEPDVERVSLPQELQVDIRGTTDTQISCQNPLSSEVNIEAWKSQNYCKSTIEAVEAISDGHASNEPDEHTLLPDPVNNIATSPGSHESSVSPTLESPPAQMPPSQPLSWAQMASQQVAKPTGRAVHVSSHQHFDDKPSTRQQPAHLQGQVNSKFRGAGQRQQPVDDKPFGAGDHGQGPEHNTRQGAPGRINTGGRGGPRGGRVFGGRGGALASGGRIPNTITAGGMGPRRG